jgi:hypothetical protein
VRYSARNASANQSCVARLANTQRPSSKSNDHRSAGVNPPARNIQRTGRAPVSRVTPLNSSCDGSTAATLRNKRAQDAQLRIADQITRFAGSMQFVYLHIALFTVWMLFIESKPTLTLIVSLEAISCPPSS